MENEDGLTMRGVPVPDPHNARVAREAVKRETERVAKEDAARLERERTAQPPPNLMEELVAEFNKLEAKDKMIPSIRMKIEDLQYRSRRCRIEILARQKHLRAKAATVIRARHGIRVIPGYTESEFSYKKEIMAMSPRIAQLLKRLNVVLPDHFDRDQIESSTTEPQP